MTCVVEAESLEALEDACREAIRGPIDDWALPDWTYHIMKSEASASAVVELFVKDAELLNIADKEPTNGTKDAEANADANTEAVAPDDEGAV